MDQISLSCIVLLVLCCLPFFPWSDLFPASDPLRLHVPISSLLLPFTFLCHFQPSLRDRLILMSGFHLCFNFVSYSLSDPFMGTLYLSLISTHRPTSPPPKYLNLPLCMASLSLAEHTSRQWRTRPLSFKIRGESSWPDRLW
jgi:hypothetical protein